jgi:L-ascorbate metabolism protein UlaG (beta-lactamase superfamily)
MLRTVTGLLLCGIWSCATAAENPVARAHYIANMGAMIEHGDTRIVFDPLFDNDYGTYDRVPAAVEDALMAGAAPFDGIDAVFVSHYHGDHYDPAAMLKLLIAQPSIELFGPEQAAAALRKLIVDPDDPLLKRVHGLSLTNGATAIDIEFGPLLIEATRVPHEGWPEYHKHVENLVFRVTLDNRTTVMHFGDAGPVAEHFATDPEHWDERQTHFAMPPYWFFFSGEGRRILEDRIKAVDVVGMHVPTKVSGDPASRPESLQDVDLFTKPGEVRTITPGSAAAESSAVAD